MKNSIRKLVFYIINFIFYAVYTPFIGGVIVNWKVNEAGAGYVVIFFLMILGIGYGILHIIIDASKSKYNDMGVFLIPPIICGILGLIYIPISIKLTSIAISVKYTLLLIVYGIVISTYNKIFSYLLGTYYGRFNTTIVMVFSIPTIFMIGKYI
ncbi:MAG: hypothetical protein KQI81_23295 [Deltaproteobacteria bacterium]|nr:hypothetical protein [Deltaproteobacteria bacterium]